MASFSVCEDLIWLRFYLLPTVSGLSFLFSVHFEFQRVDEKEELFLGSPNVGTTPKCLRAFTGVAACVMRQCDIRVMDKLLKVASGSQLPPNPCLR